MSAVALSIGLALGTGALADETMEAAKAAMPNRGDTLTPSGTVAGWSLFANETRHSCLAQRNFGDNAIQMGLTPGGVYGYLGVFSRAPTDAQSGKMQDITIQLGGRNYVGQVFEMAGNLSEGFSGGYVISKNAEFINSLAAEPSMTVITAGRDPIQIPLDGSRRAIEAIKACNAKMAM